jgi:ribosomal protein S18 acetylase RimI-like enzyme
MKCGMKFVHNLRFMYHICISMWCRLMSQNPKPIPLALQPPDASLRIRTVTPQDVVALRADCWSHRTVTRSHDLIQRIKEAEKFERGLGIVVLDEEGICIIGYGQIMRWTTCAEISDLIVSPTRRSNGIGTAMIQYLIHNISHQSIDCIEIGVSQTNPRAAALYYRLGFTYYTTLEIAISGDEKASIDYLRIPLEKPLK